MTKQKNAVKILLSQPVKLSDAAVFLVPLQALRGENGAEVPFCLRLKIEYHQIQTQVPVFPPKPRFESWILRTPQEN